VPRGLLANAVALTQVSLNATRVIAPALAGVVISFEAFGTTGVYIITTVVMVLSLLVTFRLPRRPAVARTSDRSVIGEFVDGVRYARRDPLLKMLIITSFVMVMAGWPYLAFLPAVSNDLFDAGASGLGIMSSVSAVAALGFTFWIAGRTRPNDAWRIQSISGVVLAIGLLALAAAPSFILALVALFVVGGAASGYQSMNSTIVLTLTDLEYHGRVQSLLMLSFSGFGMAALPLGIVADSVGLRTMFTIMGGICLVTMGLYVVVQARHRRRGGNFDLRDSPA
jgi:sugar phosphate permease